MKTAITCSEACALIEAPRVQCPNNTNDPNTQGQANERQNTKCMMSVWWKSRASYSVNLKHLLHFTLCAGA